MKMNLIERYADFQRIKTDIEGESKTLDYLINVTALELSVLGFDATELTVK